MNNLIKTVLGLFLTVAVTQANAVVWEVSPDGNAAGNDISVTTGVDGYLFDLADSALQPSGVFGVGYSQTGIGATVEFDANLSTWDSYNAATDVTGTGYYDAFIVMISDVGYYWNLEAITGIPLSDPITADASTFVWGGTNWNDGIEEFYTTAPGGSDTLTASGEYGTWYVSFVLDTATLPNADNLHPSWGTFHVNVPEPGTLLLLGGGLLGLTFTGRRKRNNS